MDEDKLLRRPANNRTNARLDSTVKLAETIQRVMDNSISPRQARFALIDDAWSRILPESLRLHCRLTDTTGGTLKVKVDSPVYLHELRLCKTQLLKQLQQDCPRAKITNIQFAVG